MIYEKMNKIKKCQKVSNVVCRIIYFVLLCTLMLRTLVFEMLALHPAQSQCYKNQTIYYMGQNYLRKKAWCILGSLKAEILHDGGTKTLVYWDQNGHEQEKLITLHNCEQFAIRCGLSGGTFGNSCR